MLYLIGILHWYLFMQLGNPTWKTFDWRVTHQVAHDVIHEAVSQKRIPYHVTSFDVPIIGTPIETGTNGSYDVRWFSNGYPMVSIQAIIFGLFNTPLAMTLNIIFYYSIGFIGLILWSNKLNLNRNSFFFLFMIMSFCGYIVSRIGVGHSGSVNSYLYISLYFWFLYKFIEIKEKTWYKNLSNVFQFSLFIFFAALNCNGAQIYQFMFIGMIVMLFYPKQWLWYLLSLVLSFVLMIFYIIPTALFSSYMKAERIYFAGYGFQSGDSGIPLIDHNSASNILEKGLYHGINILNHLWESLTVAFTAAHDATWEYNLYIGKFGLILILLSVAMLIFKNRKNFDLKKHRYLFPALIVALLSVSVFKPLLVSVFETITQITIPKVDRMASRLMIYPFSLVLMFAAIGFDDLFAMIPERFRSFMKWGSILILFIILMEHSYGWSVAQTESHFVRPPDGVRHLFKTVILDIEGDDYYKNVVNISYMVSFFMFLTIVSAYFYLNKIIRKNGENQAV